MMIKNILFLCLILCVSCNRSPDAKFESYCVSKDKHNFKPEPLTWSLIDSIEYQWIFTESMRYNLNGDDQHDWNKLFGISADFLTNHQNSMMVAWRYWPGVDNWDITPYYHEEGNVYRHGNTENIPLINLYYGDTLTTKMKIISPDRKIIEVHVSTGNQGFHFYNEYDVSFNKVRLIGGWFGGNKTAPHKMCIYKKRIQ